jgi:hypothetical protein
MLLGSKLSMMMAREMMRYYDGGEPIGHFNRAKNPQTAGRIAAWACPVG